jgi:beta-phosphoglucomutase-like phosphatase (HAD superfamily)
MKVIVAGDDPALKNGKPAPDIYIEAAKRLNVDPKDCLVFEDALSGVRSGKSAGCQAVAIPDERFSEEDLQTYRDEADVVLRSLWDFDGSRFGIDVNMATVFGNPSG